MSDLISRQAAIDMLATMQGLCGSKAALVQNSKIWQQIKDLPSAEPRKGKWIEREEDMDGMTLQIKRCSECGASKPMKIFRLENYEFNFCPNCGARMSEGETDD